ncbi:MAG: histidine--tRNA ligase [Chloroflexi bacterium]|nr:histidine--tRNA ligase [Chloroflexota bacterium]
MYRVPRGTMDVLPADQPYWRHVLETAERLCRLYGYQRLDTPLFEDASLFQRSVGAGTDIVEKETYNFQDRSGELLTLRPEGTAPVCRAYLEHGMHALPQPIKLYYIAPCFRYERPQAGRYRQFYQWGYEAIGSMDPALDAEVVEIAWRLYQLLGITDLVVLLNSIGDPQCRPAYLKALVAYYSAHRGSLCRDCGVRLEKNPLRLLDCKEPQDQPLIQGAPRAVDYLCPECRGHHAQVEHYLALLGVPYQMEHRLVRGLDYYTKTVFEVVPRDGGSQNAIGAGGRYDGLIEELGGRPTPGIGFAAGIDRIILNLKRQGLTLRDGSRPQVYVAYLGDRAKDAALRLTAELRAEGLNTLLAFGDRSLRAQLRHANSTGAPYSLILGEDEVQAGEALLRRMEDGEQERVPLTHVAARLSQAVASQPGP